MAQTPFSLLLLRRFSSQNPNLHHRRLPSFIRTTITTTTHSYYLTSKPFSSSLSPLQPTPPNPSDPNTLTLSARMSFVFDQIDAIEKDRSTKDQALQRIRTWRESKKKNTTKDHTLGLGSGFTETIDSNESDSTESGVKKEREGLLTKEVELAHPWPEWIELMERLVQQNYFDHRRKDEDKMMVSELGFDMSEVAEEGFDFTRDWKTVQTACLNFGRDRFDILRSLSRQDIQILVGYGCPNVDKKVVFSAKLLRKHVHLDEGDVCSSCSLRSSCERAYLVTNKEDEARTLDVVRVLLTFGFDPVNGSVINKSLLKLKSVKTVVRKLLHEVVKLSAVPIDPNLPPPVIKKPPPKVKQPPPPPRKRVGRDDIEMKKGDWLCPKCDFMNFAKNTVCLQCDAKRPKRQLLPGEWECPECNFLNYRRNVACFHCEHKRPPDEFMEIQKQERQHGPRTRLDKVASRSEVSNAWNFDFDDDESDGADVAAFEFADSPRMGEDSPLDSRAQGGNFRGPEDDLYKASRTPRAHEREYSDPDHKKPGIGFDDFDDEEDDDVDSYELDNSPVQKASSNAISGVEEYSEFEDIEGFDDNLHGRRRTSSPSNNKPSKQIRRKAAFSGSEDDEVGFDSDEELPVHPNWKSSHVADSRQRSRGRGPMSFGSDEELGLASGSDDDLDENFGSRQSKGNKMGSGRRDSRQSKGNRMGSSRRDVRRRGNSDIEDDSFSGSESDDNDLHSHRNKLRGNKAGPDRRGNTLRGREDFDFAGDTRFRSKGMMGDRRNSFNDNFDRSSRGSHGNNRGSRGDDSGGRRMNDRGGNLRHFDGPRREGSGNRQHGRFNKFDNRNDRGDDLRNFDGPRREGSGNRQRGKFNKFDNRNDRGGDLRNFDGPRREGSGNQQRGRFNKFDNRSDMGSDFGNDRPRRQRIIER